MRIQVQMPIYLHTCPLPIQWVSRGFIDVYAEATFAILGFWKKLRFHFTMFPVKKPLKWNKKLKTKHGSFLQKYGVEMSSFFIFKIVFQYI